MKSSVKIFFEHFDESTTHQQLYYKIIINIKKSSKAIHVLNKVL